MKKVLLLIFIISLLFNINVYADENILTLDNVLKNVEQNSAFKTMDHAIFRLDKAYVKLKDIVDKMPVALIHTMNNQMLANMGLPHTNKDKLEWDKTVYNQPDKILSAINILKNNKKLTLNSLKLGGEQLYYGLILSSEGLKLQQEVTNLSSLQLKNAQEKFDQGLISKNDLDISIEQDKQNKLKLESQKRSQQNIIYSLNKMMGKDLKTSYDNYDANIEEMKMPEINLENDISNALEKRLEIFNIKEDIRFLDKELFFAKIYYNETDNAYLQIVNKKNIAEEKLENTKNDIRFELETAYETININYDNIEKAKIGLDSANNDYKAMEDRYNSGLITKDILDGVHIKLNAAKISLLSAIVNYNMSIKKYDAATQIGPAFK